MPARLPSPSLSVVALWATFAMGLVLTGCEGPAGPTGSQGERGPPGPEGPEGTIDIVYTDWMDIEWNLIDSETIKSMRIEDENLTEEFRNNGVVISSRSSSNRSTSLLYPTISATGRSAMCSSPPAESSAPSFQLFEEIERVAEAADATPAQVALAWVLGRSESILTIPGTTKLRHLESNLAAAEVTLTPDQIGRLDTLAEKVKGERYNEQGMATVDG